jgi:hypothetical protein
VLKTGRIDWQLAVLVCGLVADVLVTDQLDFTACIAAGSFTAAVFELLLRCAASHHGVSWYLWQQLEVAASIECSHAF